MRRAMALLHLAAGHSVSETARWVCAARSTVQQWRGLYEKYGEAGLVPASRGRRARTVSEEMVSCLRQLLERLPEDYGYLRAGWSSELLAQELERQLAVAIHASTARRLLLILDNYIIHKSEQTQRWLANNRKFRLMFQPTYSPWLNQIERLWKAMHDTVTRNHRCTSFAQFAQRIVRFVDAVQPFLGNQHALASLEV